MVLEAVDVFVLLGAVGLGTLEQDGRGGRGGWRAPFASGGLLVSDARLPLAGRRGGRRRGCGRGRGPGGGRG